MRIAFLNVAAAGHINPTLPIAAQLQEDGARVAYFAPPGAQHRGAPGIDFRPILDPVTVATGGASDRAEILVRALTAAQQRLPELVGAVAAVRPDALVYDRSAPWGRWVAQRLGIPSIQLLTTYALRAESAATRIGAAGFDRPGRELRRALRGYARAVEANAGQGLTSLRPQDVFVAGDRHNLVTVARTLQADADDFDGSYTFVGPCLPRTLPRRAAATRTAFVSTGSVLPGDAGLMQACLSAFPPEDWEVVLAVGAAAPELSRQAPAGWTVQAQVDQLDVLARASVFVTHGGMNSVQEAAFLGVPLVVVPRTPENQRTAARVEALGLGLAVALDRLDGEALRRAVRAAQAPAVARGLQRFAEHCGQSGGTRRACEVIVAAASGSGGAAERRQPSTHHCLTGEAMTGTSQTVEGAVSALQSSHPFRSLPKDCGQDDHPGVDEVEGWRDWSSFEPTPDQRRIEAWLAKLVGSDDRLLHVGVGGSQLAQAFASRVREIVGITISPGEVGRGNALGLDNYRVLLRNKYQPWADAPRPLDVVIDNNLTTFACCLSHVVTMLDWYATSLAPTGFLLTDRVGLGWVVSADGGDPAWGLDLAALKILAGSLGLTVLDLDGDVYAVAMPGGAARLSRRAVRRPAIGGAGRG
jgi:MGT family glycosyltransferase